MRLLWARVGIPYSPATGLPIESQTVSQMVDRVLALPERTRLYLLAPVVRGRKGEYRKEIADLHEARLPAAEDRRDILRDRRSAGARQEAQARYRGRRRSHRRAAGSWQRGLPESFETALELADGIAIVEYADEKDDNGKPKQIVFSSKFACPVSGFTIPEIEPRLFSFNNPFGACPDCSGLGSEATVDPELIVPDPKLSLRKGAIAPWAKSTSPYYLQTLEALAKHYKFRLDTPLKRCRKRCARSSSTAPATSRSAFPTTTGCAPMT